MLNNLVHVRAVSRQDDVVGSARGAHNFIPPHMQVDVVVAENGWVGLNLALFEAECHLQHLGRLLLELFHDGAKLVGAI